MYGLSYRERPRADAPTEDARSDATDKTTCFETQRSYRAQTSMFHNNPPPFYRSCLRTVYLPGAGTGIVRAGHAHAAWGGLTLSLEKSLTQFPHFATIMALLRCAPPQHYD